ncbi:MBL fold metallo-hydrolase [bacterium]|nr:MBL fold metallo-hydrolase [bacterium]
MILKSLPTGPLGVNCYIVGDESTGDAAVFDPGGDAEDILALLAVNGLTCRLIVNTHTHWDHIGGNADMKAATGAPFVVHEKEVPGLASYASQAAAGGIAPPPMPDKLLKEGDTIAIGGLTGRCVELRGHSPCALGIIFDKQKVAIVGDILFAGSIGRTDLDGGNVEHLLEDVRTKLFVLPDDTVVLPGHGPATTIGREKRFNPFF